MSTAASGCPRSRSELLAVPRAVAGLGASGGAVLRDRELHGGEQDGGSDEQGQRPHQRSTAARHARIASTAETSATAIQTQANEPPSSAQTNAAYGDPGAAPDPRSSRRGTHHVHGQTDPDDAGEEQRPAGRPAAGASAATAVMRRAPRTASAYAVSTSSAGYDEPSASATSYPSVVRVREANRSPSSVRSWCSRGIHSTSAASIESSAHSVVPLKRMCRPLGSSSTSIVISATTKTWSRSRPGMVKRSPGVGTHGRPRPRRKWSSRSARWVLITRPS